jgi:hypothetical protein
MASTESSAAPGGDGHTQERACLNCGCALAGEFCHCCGQRAHVHRTLGAFWHDLAHGVLHFEGRIWRTLPLLLVRPGELTRRYIDGERARFVSPLALFLFSAFLMFTTVNLLTPLGSTSDLGISQSIEYGVAEERARLRKLEQERAAATGDAARELDERIRETREDIRDLENLQQRGGSEVTAVRNRIAADNWLERAIKKGAENPELLLYKLKTNAYKFGWALIPISVPFLWLLFPFSRRFSLYDHAVFVTYSITFMSLLVVVAVALGAAGAGGLAGLAVLVPPFHMYVQVRRTYGLGRWGALWRTVMLLLFANIVIGLFAALLIALGAAG